MVKNSIILGKNVSFLSFGFFMNLLPSISWRARTALAGHLETDLRDFSRNLELSLPLNPHLTPLVLSTLGILDRYIYLCDLDRLHLIQKTCWVYSTLGTSPELTVRLNTCTLYSGWVKHSQ